MTRAAAVLGVLLVTSCAYFNGIYNARQAEKRGDRLSRAGSAALAAAAYESTAVKAESVLAHHADSKWADDARYLAGRGWALSGRCERAVPLLDTVLSAPALDDRHAARAKVALGICRGRQGEYARALEMLAPFVRHDDRVLERSAALWAGRSALALGRRAEAMEYLERAGTATRDWELVRFHLERGEPEVAESALVRRAATGDGDPRLDTSLVRLWNAGARASAERVVAAADESRLSPARRGRLHIALADLWRAAGDDSAALAHLARARETARDTLVAREVAARSLELQLRTLGTLADVETAVAAARRRARGTAILQRLEDHLLLIGLLQQRSDASGSGTFLAAEVARDSLESPTLALTLFRRIPESAPASPFAPKALLAASMLAPDSAPAYHAMLEERYPASPYAAADGSASSETMRALESRLADLWSSVTAVWADSVKKLREREQSPGGGSSPVLPR